MDLNICYIVGTTLLYMNKLSFTDLEKIGNKLSNKGYKVDTSEENIYAMLTEWHDFFIIDENSYILLSKGAKKSKYIIELIFNSMLDPKTNGDIVSSILNRNKQKCKIIKFR